MFSHDPTKTRAPCHTGHGAAGRCSRFRSVSADLPLFRDDVSRTGVNSQSSFMPHRQGFSPASSFPPAMKRPVDCRVSFMPINFYHRMRSEDVCLCVSITPLLSVFFSSHFPHEAQPSFPQTHPPNTPLPSPPQTTPFSPRHSFHVNENAVFLLLYQMTRKCVTLTLRHKTTKYLQSAVLKL